MVKWTAAKWTFLAQISFNTNKITVWKFSLITWIKQLHKNKEVKSGPSKILPYMKKIVKNIEKN